MYGRGDCGEYDGIGKGVEYKGDGEGGHGGGYRGCGGGQSDGYLGDKGGAYDGAYGKGEGGGDKGCDGSGVCWC